MAWIVPYGISLYKIVREYEATGKYVFTVDELEKHSCRVVEKNNKATGKHDFVILKEMLEEFGGSLSRFCYVNPYSVTLNISSDNVEKANVACGGLSYEMLAASMAVMYEDGIIKIPNNVKKVLKDSGYLKAEKTNEDVRKK